MRRSAVQGLSVLLLLACVGCSPGDSAADTGSGASPTAAAGASTAPSAAATAPAASAAPAGEAGQELPEVGDVVTGDPRLEVAELPDGLRALQEAVGAGDLDGFTGLFTADAVVRDGSRQFDGREAIGSWAQSEVLGDGAHYDVFEVERVEPSTLRWTGAFQRSASAVADEPRGCFLTRFDDAGLIAEWLIGGCEL
jgi:hypothetical protein